MRAALLILVVSCLGAAVGAAGAEQVTGGVVYKPGNGVSAPRVIHDVKPQYAADAMKAKVQGVVELEFVVLPDGTVGDVKVVRSLHASLDKEAVKAVKQWQFKPGTKDGEPVAVLVSAELTFTLGKRSGQPLLPTLPLGTVETPPTAAAPAPGVVYKPGDGVSPPRVVYQIRPLYPDAAKESGIQGVVALECVVQTDGTISDIRVTRSLDVVLDLEAVKAVQQWRFEPGTRDEKPVPVQVEIELTFTLR